MAEKEAMPAGLGLPLALTTGFLYAAAANFASYHSAQQKRSGVPLGSRKSMCVDVTVFCVYCLGGLIITAAYASGQPVPVLNAVMVATTLLLNMVFQVGLRIEYYSKEMRVGTIVFALAVFQLAHIGPSPRGDIDIQATVMRPLALAWNVSLLALLLLSAVGMRATASDGADSISKIVSWSMNIAVLGSLTDNFASLFGLLRGGVLVAAMGGYGAVALFTMVLSSKAPALCDASLYVPMQLCLQMVFNMASGFFVWQDEDRLTDTSSYLAAFAICLLSVYMSSENLDLMASGRVMAASQEIMTLDRSQFGCSVLELVDCWRQQAGDPSEEHERQSAAAFRELLEHGLRRGVFTAGGVAHPGCKVVLAPDLAASLQGDRGGGASARAVRWLERAAYFESYAQGHPEFRETLRSCLSPKEQRLLEALEDHDGRDSPSSQANPSSESSEASIALRTWSSP